MPPIINLEVSFTMSGEGEFGGGVEGGIRQFFTGCIFSEVCGKSAFSAPKTFLQRYYLVFIYVFESSDFKKGRRFN